MESIFDIMARRRSVRAYREEQITEEELQTILEAGRNAPSGGNARTTHLIVIQNKEVLEQLRGVVEQEFAQMEYREDLYKSLRHSIKASQAGGYEFFFRAPTLIVVTNRIGYGNAMADSSCVLENMMIAATALNIGSCWINQLHWLDEHEAVRSFLCSLGMGADETVCGGLSLGYPADPNVFKVLEKEGNVITYIR